MSLDVGRCHICDDPRAACFTLESATPPQGCCLEKALAARTLLKRLHDARPQAKAEATA